MRSRLAISFNTHSRKLTHKTYPRNPTQITMPLRSSTARCDGSLGGRFAVRGRRVCRRGTAMSSLRGYRISPTGTRSNTAGGVLREQPPTFLREMVALQAVTSGAGSRSSRSRRCRVTHYREEREGKEA